MTAHEQYDDLVAAYALGALDPEARPAFEVHLASCATCRATLADLRRVSAAIGLSADAVEPPASLRARTLARAMATSAASQMPQVPSVAKPRHHSANPLLSFALAASLLALVGVSVYAWMLRTELGATRESIAAMGQRVETLRTQLMTLRAEAARLVNTVNVLRSTDLVRVDLRGQATAPQATGRAFVSQGHALVLRADHLPGLAPNRTYQLWVVSPEPGAAPVSAGVYMPDPGGSLDLTIPLPAGIRLVKAVALTEEPAGGSVRATTAPMLIGSAN
jgi:anti-sigma-K factor RskA